MTQFVVAVHEYLSAKPTLSASPSLPPFTFNERQLVIAMVRAILTAKSGKPARKLVAAITWPTLRFMLDQSVAPRLEISSQCQLSVRDFSLTSRVGELAQGVAFAYWHWARGYHWISDFAPWAAGLKPKLPPGKAPDFVMLHARSGDLAVMEAKGTGSHCHKAQIRKALAQCSAGLQHMAFDRGYGSVLTLDQRRTMSGCGALHICDPERPKEPSDETQYAVFRRSYASWFELAGDDQMAAWCRMDPAQSEYRSAAPSPQSLNRPRTLLPDAVLPGLGFDPRRTIFTLDFAPLAALRDFEVFRRRDWLQEMRWGQADSRESIHFPDGTAIVQE